MRTTVDIDEKLLEEAEKLVGENSPSKLLNMVLAEYVRRKKLEELRASLGSWDLNVDDWDEFRHMER